MPDKECGQPNPCPISCSITPMSTYAQVGSQVKYWEVAFHNDSFQRDGFDTSGRIHYYGTEGQRILRRDLRACKACHADITLKDVETVQGDPERVRRFQKILMDAGFVATVRKTRGDDIDAACGQLAGDVKDRTRVDRRIAQQRTVMLRPVPADTSKEA